MWEVKNVDKHRFVCSLVGTEALRVFDLSPWPEMLHVPSQACAVAVVFCDSHTQGTLTSTAFKKQTRHPCVHAQSNLHNHDHKARTRTAQIAPRCICARRTHAAISH